MGASFPIGITSPHSDRGRSEPSPRIKTPLDVAGHAQSPLPHPQQHFQRPRRRRAGEGLNPLGQRIDLADQ